MTYKWLAHDAGMSAGRAKEALAAFYEENKDHVDGLFVLTGRKEKGGAYTVLLVPALDLEEAKGAMAEPVGCHVYGVLPLTADGARASVEEWSSLMYQCDMDQMSLYAGCRLRNLSMSQSSTLCCRQTRSLCADGWMQRRWFGCMMAAPWSPSARAAPAQYALAHT